MREVLEAPQAVRRQVENEPTAHNTAEPILLRPLAPAELDRLGEIDRTERITRAYMQEGEQLIEQEVDWDVGPWSPTGSHAHSVPDQVGFLKWHVSRGATAFGAFDSNRLVGIGVVMPHIRPGIAQLSYLHVSHGYRGQGVGRRLAAELECIAIAAGDTEMVVSATPTMRTVRFYMSCGYAPMAEPLPELYEKEPEDVHLSKRIAPAS
jgi:GNAT superfamily N-acetyltransferase